MQRIINKQGLFIRDDFTFDEETEIGLDVEASQGLYQPKWNGNEWIEGASQEYIDSLKQPIVEVPLIEDRIVKLEEEQETIISVLTDIMGS